MTTISDTALFASSHGRAVRRILFAVCLFVVPSAILLIVGEALAAEAPSSKAAPAGAAASVRIVVPAHDIMRGEIIGDSDLTYAQVAGAALPSTTVTKFEVLTGMQARRLLRAGENV